MSVERNIAFGLRQDGVARAEIDQRVGEALALVRMERFAKRRPHQLSGGQRQRVALARSLIKRPKVLLLDEPLAALDKKLREQTQFELVNIQESLGVTFIIVTHDQEEAMTMSSRIAVMEAGRIMQVGTPSEIYEFPSSRFVADFIGSVNLFEGLVVEDEADHALVDCADLDLRIFIDHGITGPGNTPVSVAIRPEKMRLSTERPASGQGPTGANQLEGVVEEIAYLGDTSIYLVRLDSGRTVRVTVPNLHRSAELPISWEDRVWVTWPAYAAVVLNQ
jgi:putrescine transport system ATP-binding protein